LEICKPEENTDDQQTYDYHAVARWRYKRKVAVSISDGVIGIFH